MQRENHTEKLTYTKTSNLLKTHPYLDLTAKINLEIGTLQNKANLNLPLSQSEVSFKKY